jgi:hypothetical protein
LAILLLLIVAATLRASPARADFELFLQESGVNGGKITSVASATDFTFLFYSGTYGDFKTQLFGGASDNTTSVSDLLQSTTSVRNLSTSTKTLHLWISQTNYTLPFGSLLSVESSLGGSTSKGTLTLADLFQVWADENNNILGTSGFTNGLQSAVKNGSSFDTGSAFGTFSNANGKYSVTAEVNITMSGGGQSNFSDQVDISPVLAPSAVPAPSSVLLTISGLPVLGIGFWFRRRSKV